MANALVTAAGASAAFESGGMLLDRLRARDPGPALSPVDAQARERERLDLLAKGEVALAAGNADAALHHFERAATMRHAPDSEMALIRTYMQAGHYRRALAFGAHTAGVHRDHIGASVLYAWLLFLGGQASPARRLFEGVAARAPEDPGVRFVQQALASNAPPPAGLPLAPPLRLAPYVAPGAIPRWAMPVAGGTLIDGGRSALMTTMAIAPDTRVWIRTGLGTVGRGRVQRRFEGLGVSLVRLEQPMPMPGRQDYAVRDPHPGSILFVVDYARQRSAAPAWPQLHAGFAGRPRAGGGRALGIDLPAGSRGGPAFDAQGRLAGIALPGRPGTDRLLLPSELRAGASPAGFAESSSADVPRMPIDEVYERAMLVSVEVLARR